MFARSKKTRAKGFLLVSVEYKLGSGHLSVVESRCREISTHCT